MLELIFHWDREFLLFLQDTIRMPAFDKIWIFITRLGDVGIIWIILTVLLCISVKTRKTGMAVAVALLLSLVVNNVLLKNVVARIRPYEVIEGLTCLIGSKRDFSFPSGHAASSFAAAGVLLQIENKKWGISALILAVLIGFSRLYVGVHYPSDVIFGVFSGLLLSVLAVKLIEIYEKRKQGGSVC